MRAPRVSAALGNCLPSRGLPSYETDILEIHCHEFMTLILVRE